jgi:tRNA 5-methylaminomethyl-2-thiouridine biosynthesis bifunctional protein
LVVGAGVAGAAIARALADKGWQVDVADQAHAPAGGASAVPIGVLSCHVSVDDNPLSQLTRNGLLLSKAFAEHHLVQGQDWLACGVLERRLEGHTKEKNLATRFDEASLAWLGDHANGDATCASRTERDTST